MNRVPEMILGIVGSLFAFGSSFFALFFGAVDEAIEGSASDISSMGGTAFFFSILAFIFSILINWKPKISAIGLIICGVVILFFNRTLWCHTCFIIN